uniref:Uncharacterized protein n=1 Tax=Salix viminalis TaxID=40686 RepID=A0A6N2KTH3_SALVM
MMGMGMMKRKGRRRFQMRIWRGHLLSTCQICSCLQRLPPKIRSIILYAIAMADYDQDDRGVCQNLLKTKDGIDRLSLYQSSVGRFTNASGALIYPVYGQGELPQAFSRRSAVKGCIYVLRMPVTALLMEKWEIQRCSIGFWPGHI